MASGRAISSEFVSAVDQQSPLAATTAPYLTSQEKHKVGLIDAALKADEQIPTVHAFFGNWLHSLLESERSKVRHKP